MTRAPKCPPGMTREAFDALCNTPTEVLAAEVERLSAMLPYQPPERLKRQRAQRLARRARRVGEGRGKRGPS